MNTVFYRQLANAFVLGFVALVFAGSGRGWAMMRIAQVSKERAKELGIEVRFTDNGPNDVWVELEVRPDGKLTRFDHVSLEIRDGEKLLVGYAPLKEKKTEDGGVKVGFLVERAFLEKVTLSVVAGMPSDMTGYEIRLGEFLGR